MKKIYENPFALVVEVEDIDCITLSVEGEDVGGNGDQVDF